LLMGFWGQMGSGAKLRVREQSPLEAEMFFV